MTSDPTHSDFGRLESRLTEKDSRLEAKLDDVREAVLRLLIFEERQMAQAERLRELEHRIHELTINQQDLATELHGYVQRWVGISAAVSGFVLVLGAVWAVVSHFFPRG
jgi:hypothetical protein